jgi:16S rRNA (adenine1518-N6/adenine1519-N6)-dimethyltransferase
MRQHGTAHGFAQIHSRSKYMTKKHLGQNFLFDPSILARMVGVAALSPEDTVVEIGPGPGRLTALLAGKVKKVIAIELDEVLYTRLTGELSKYNNVVLVHGDALSYPYETLDEFKVVANIPYYITTPILFKLLDYKDRLRSITVTIQKEVAERIVAGPGGKEYGILSLMVQYYTHPKIEFIVPKGAFRPVPKVDSAVLHMVLHEKPPVIVRDERLFFKLIKTAFSQRRKTLANALKPLAQDSKERLKRAGINPMQRAETLSMEEFARLADVLGDPAP